MTDINFRKLNKLDKSFLPILAWVKVWKVNIYLVQGQAYLLGIRSVIRSGRYILDFVAAASLGCEPSWIKGTEGKL